MGKIYVPYLEPSVYIYEKGLVAQDYVSGHAFGATYHLRI